MKKLPTITLILLMMVSLALTAMFYMNYNMLTEQSKERTASIVDAELKVAPDYYQL